MLSALLLILPLSSLQVQKDLDSLLDDRWGSDKEIVGFADKLKKDKVSPERLEAMIRQKRASFAPLPAKPGEISSEIPLDCDHVDYQTGFFLQLPKDYKEGETYPLLVVFHGGNSAMSKSYATQAAQTMNHYWGKVASEAGFIMATPLTERGWSWIGTSATLSLVSKLSRSYAIDSDRIYITGHSMGGHMTWRTAMHHADRWGAVSPMSGGYDYVADGQVAALWNVPGYGTFGNNGEPYQIADFNRKIRDWMKEHKFDWTIQECPGGHTIFPDQLPKILDFFKARKRDLYRKDVFVRQTPPLKIDQSEPARAEWNKKHTWNPQRPLERNTFHWVKILEAGTKTFQDGSLARLRAINKGENRFEITSDNVRRVRLYFHPKMANLSKPIKIVLNGETKSIQVKPDLAQMLRTVRSEDDRGRIFYGYVDLAIASDKEVENP